MYVVVVFPVQEYVNTGTGPYEQFDVSYYCCRHSAGTAVVGIIYAFSASRNLQTCM